MNTLVSFRYFDENRILQQFKARCDFIPRVGEKVFPGARENSRWIVKAVLHNFVKDAIGGEWQQVVTVALGDAPASAEADPEGESA